ncbi:hypothetical protein SAMN05428949_3901 [Chitinophaga sp. YR627]|nr:hypothetical protein SAMN05428949_3901 [Chitinophaga sp. YR627]
MQQGNCFPVLLLPVHTADHIVKHGAHWLPLISGRLKSLHLEKFIAEFFLQFIRHSGLKKDVRNLSLSINK